MRDTWKVVCVGSVVEVKDLPTDKTGRNERGVVTLTVAPETLTIDVEGVTPGTTIDVAMDRARLAHKLGRAPVLGDRVRLTGTGTGHRAVRANIDSIKLVPAETEA